jgi:single-strand DNA-binding protein
MNGLHAAATGRVVSDPEQRFTGTGKALVQFTVLVDQQGSATEGHRLPEALFLRATAWEPSDELLAQLRKGASVYVEGKLTHNQWTTAEGAARCGLNVSCWRVDVHAQIGKNALRREAIPA